jgi:hypothetical protein
MQTSQDHNTNAKTITAAKIWVLEKREFHYGAPVTNKLAEGRGSAPVEYEDVRELITEALQNWMSEEYETSFITITVNYSDDNFLLATYDCLITHRKSQDHWEESGRLFLTQGK